MSIKKSYIIELTEEQLAEIKSYAGKIGLSTKKKFILKAIEEKINKIKKMEEKYK